MEVVVHYSEIGTKGKNRAFFEKKLIENLKRLKRNFRRVYKRYGRIICELREDSNFFEAKERLELFPGISNFMLAEKTALKIEEIKRVCLNLLKQREFETFKIESSRSNKKFEKTSQEVNEIIGSFVAAKLNKKVELKEPDVMVHIEIGEKEVFIGLDKYKGIGGLPVGSSGKVVASLSGGIDSPVASYLMMKRGCEVVFCHIYNSTQVGEASLEKIKEIVDELTKIQLRSKLYILPFEKIQKKIIMDVPSKYRMIVYRRFMMKILDRVLAKERARAILTGDSVGQVASQTLENLRCIRKASNELILSPLVGLNKQEIVEIAKKIRTYDYSIQPYPDCCSFMISKHPETRAKIEEILEIEKRIKNQEKLIEECIVKAKLEKFEFR